MADSKITQLASLAQLDAQAGVDVVPVADVSAAETKKITLSALVASGIAGLPDGVIAGTKIMPGSITGLEIGAGAIGAAELTPGAVGTASLANGAVTAAKIANGAVGAAQIAAGSIGSAQLIDGSVGTIDLADGSVTEPKIANSAVTANKLAAGSVTALQIASGAVGTSELVDGAVTDAKIAGPITPSKLGNQVANIVLAGPAAGAAGAPSFRSLAPADLPKATAIAVGAVSVPAAGGLVVSSSGSIALGTVVAPSTSAVVTYGADGRITAGRALTASDLPLASNIAVGAVKTGSGLAVQADGTLNVALTSALLPLATSTAPGAVKPGAPLEVSTDGTLTLPDIIPPGSGVKIAYSAKGLVTGAGTLTAADVPGLDASKIISGSLNGSLIAARSISNDRLADYALSYIQEAAPSVGVGAHPIGTLWFNPASATLCMWDGNRWAPVGQGALSAENLRFCGIFDATTGIVTKITPFGTSSGIQTTVAIPPASNVLTGAYLICEKPGVHVGTTYDAGDWIVCLGQAAGWVRIDTLNSGGGSGVSRLDSLVDVAIAAPARDQILAFNGVSWVNTDAPDPGLY